MMRLFGCPLPLLLLLLLAFKWGFLFLPSESFSHEVLALQAFKVAIFEDPLSKLSDWSVQKDPCGWTGVTCSDADNSVISLNLSSSSLKGFLVQQLGLISNLQELALDNNSFLGSIPHQIGMLKSLNLLDLSANQLSGTIPPEIGNLTSITKLYLQSNDLRGSIPPELGDLVSLMELRLDNNNLSGTIPGNNDSNMYNSQNNSAGLCQLTQLKVVNFSYNFLVGNIPSCLKNIPSSSFQGNCFDDKDLMQQSAQQCGSGNSQEGTKEPTNNFIKGPKQRKLPEPFWLLILEIATGALVIGSFITCLAFSFKKCKPRSSVVLPWRKTSVGKDHPASTIDSDLQKNVVRISRQELEAACEDFSNIIGSSLDSVVYKGIMKGGNEIAVISLCISENQWTSFLEMYFQSEVANLSRLHHANIARLLGYCQEHDPFSRMLVFEYAPNGTLYEHIHYGDGYQLTWIRRMKIAVGIACGLRYLHTELQPPFTISELTANAVYLTEDFSPKLVDFERWKDLFSKLRSGSDHLMVGGAFPVLGDLEKQHLAMQENTYEYGLILLELISGKSAYSKDKGLLSELAAKYLDQPQDIGKLDPALEKVKPEDLSVISSVVSLCLQPEPSKRPSMQIIAAMLEDGIDTSVTAILKESPLAWAELVLSS